MNYRECYEEARRILAGAGIVEADLDARLLLEHVCGTDRNDLLVHGDRLVEEEKKDTIAQMVQKRARHIPLQQLTGSQDFMGLTFLVNEQVLIPRQDTEILVEEVMKELHDGMKVLDMCTGSGCILISLMHYSNECIGVGADLSEDALSVARENAKQLLGEDKPVEFVQSDLFGNVSGTFDLIVSNPPYIPKSVIPTLMPEVRDHEPISALDGGEDGLAFYRQIIAKSPEYLVRGGRLYFEIGYDQADAVKELLETAGYQEITIVQDYAGLNRVIYGTYIGGRNV